MPRPDLRTIRGVELAKVGTWEISTGTWKVTAKALASAVALHASSGHRKPPLKLGHDDARFDGSPSVGYVDNLRLADNGQTLVGDYVGVPAWLAGVMASAYPSRSVEAVEFKDGTMQLTAVALLGVTGPGIPTIRSLSDVERLYSGGVAASAPTRLVHLVQASAPWPRVTPRSRTPQQAAALSVAASRRRSRRAAFALDQLNGGTS